MATQEEQVNPDEQAYPANWVWEEDGEDLGDRWRLSEGRFVDLREGRTVRGKRGILILEVDGEERSVWLFHSPLIDKLFEELADRVEETFLSGERLTIDRYKEKATSGSTGQRYVPYKVFFVDAPKRSPSGILGGGRKSTAESEPKDEEASENGDGGEADIPF